MGASDVSHSSDTTETTDTSAIDAEALELLRALTGRSDAVFHDGQLEAIRALVADRRRALVVQRTGWGKSAVYFIATLLLRRRGSGPTLLVSPLLALMRDQVAAASRAGVRAAALNSANAHEWTDVQQRIAAGEVDVLLVSPERLNNPRFRDEQLPDLIRTLGMLVVDEAHCISDWGHDFRPDYRRLADLIRTLPADIPVLATTATANSRVVRDVEEQLASGADVLTIRGSLARSSLRLGVLTLPSSRERLGWLVDHLRDLPGSGIIYTLTISAADDTARLLRDAGYDVRSYSGRTDPEEREQLEQRLKENDLKALVATSALGMGFDKPDLGFVVHLGAPSSPVAYYQQIGRAGRATDNADVLLLPGREDAEIWQYFATASMPSEARASAVLTELAGATAPLSSPALEARVDIKRTPLELMLKVLDVDGAVQRVQGGWQSTGVAWHYDGERYDRIAAARVDEQNAMLRYQEGSVCRMQLLQADLDDPAASPCGRCDVCAGVWYPTSIGESAATQANGALDRVGVEIEPRAQWPTGADRAGVSLRGKIPPAERVEEGRALARLTDLGWGTTLREVFAAGSPDAPLSRGLFDGCVRVLADWPWSERPTGIVAMPSASHPRLVESLASALSSVGRLPLLGSLTSTRASAAPSLESAASLKAATSQEASASLGPAASPRRGGNSVYRLADTWQAFEIGPELAAALADHHGPVLLVDDLVDSRWTLTVAGRLLRRAGADAVLPFALAVVG